MIRSLKTHRASVIYKAKHVLRLETNKRETKRQREREREKKKIITTKTTSTKQQKSVSFMSIYSRMNERRKLIGTCKARFRWTVL